MNGLSLQQDPRIWMYTLHVKQPLGVVAMPVLRVVRFQRSGEWRNTARWCLVGPYLDLATRLASLCVSL